MGTLCDFVHDFIPLKQYQKLLEDLHDLAVIAERREEEPVSFEEMRHRLKGNGTL